MQADEARQVLSLIGGDFLPGMDEALIEERLRSLSPVRLASAISMHGAGDGNRASLEFEGDFGDLRIEGDGALTGDLASLDGTNIVLHSRVSGVRDSDLLTLAGIGPVPEGDSDTPRELLTLTVQGSLIDGANVTGKAQVLDAVIEVQGVAQLVDDDVSFKTEVAVASAQPTRLYEALGVPTVWARVDDATVELAGSIVGKGRNYEIPSFGGRAAGVDVGFSGTVALGATAAAVNGDLTMSALPLASLFADTDSAETARSLSATPFPTALPDGYTFDLALAVGEVALDDLSVAQSVQGRVRTVDGALELSDIHMDVAGGAASVNGRIAPSGGGFAVTADYVFTDLDLALLRGGDEQSPQMTGALSLSGHIEGEGRSPLGLVTALTGQGDYTWLQPALIGPKPQALADELGQVAEVDALDALLSETLTGGTMALPTLSGAYRLEAGVVRFVRALFATPGADGVIDARFDLTAFETRTQWWIGLIDFPEAPDLSITLDGTPGAIERRIDTTELKSFFAARVIAENMRQLEELQERQKRELARIEALERAAAMARRERALHEMHSGQPRRQRPTVAQPQVSTSEPEPQAEPAPMPLPDPAKDEPATDTASLPGPDSADADTLLDSGTPTSSDVTIIEIPEPAPAPEPEPALEPVAEPEPPVEATPPPRSDGQDIFSSGADSSLK